MLLILTYIYIHLLYLIPSHKEITQKQILTLKIYIDDTFL